LGLPIAWYVTPADLSDPQGARRLLGGLAYFVTRLKKIWADAAYRGKELAEWRRQQGAGWVLEVVEREPGTRGFVAQPRRWVVERSFAWLSRNQRLTKDYERRVQTSETLIELAATRLLLHRLAEQVTREDGQDALSRASGMRRRPEKGQYRSASAKDSVRGGATTS
jgi:putative transposase